MRQIAGQLAQGVELFALLFEAGDFADTIEQHGDAALPHGGDGEQHFGEDLPVKIESPCVGDDKAVSSMRLHAREGKEPGDLSGPADKESSGGASFAANVNFTLEDNTHFRGGLAFMEERGSGRL